MIESLTTTSQIVLSFNMMTVHLLSLLYGYPSEYLRGAVALRFSFKLADSVSSTAVNSDSIPVVHLYDDLSLIHFLNVIFVFGPMSSSHYVYDPLPSPASIRLIQLLLPENDSLNINLFTIELENALPFDALSYTWGDPRSPYVNTISTNPHVDYNTSSIRILCNSMTMLIRKNLYDALRMLQTRSFDSVGKTRQPHVWIDAISIDQSNPDERAAQVKIMSTIYGQGKMVIAWIGPEDVSTPDAFTVISRLNTVATIPQSSGEAIELMKKYRSIITTADFIDPETQRAKLGIEALGPEHWVAWTVLLRRPYFKRVWIV